MTANGPACAYCGNRYDFANRPVHIENCCPDCLPQPKGRTVSITITPRFCGGRVARKPRPILRTRAYIEFQEAMDRAKAILDGGQSEPDAES